MSKYEGKSEYRERQEYKESLPYGSSHHHGIAQAAPYVLIGVLVLLALVLIYGWLLWNWVTLVAYHEHPMGVLLCATVVGLIVVCIPVWKAKVAIDHHTNDMRDREARRLLLTAQAEALLLNAKHGFNTEIIEGVTTVRVINPLSIAAASKETNNYYGDGYENEEDAPPIEAPKSSDEYLNISADYQPHADEFLSGRKLIVGISGSGKSNSVADICEEYGQLGVPMVLADTENEYRSLGDTRWLPNAMLAGREQVTPENAEQFGHYVLDNHKQVILDLTDYDEMEEAALVMVNIIKGMRAWEEKFANELRIPCEFLLEEATTWLPQNVGESPLKGTDVWQPLQDAFFNNLVRKGRKRGLGLTVICQKIAEIDKRALQSDVKIFHRQTEPRDIEVYRKSFHITPEESASLKNGEAYYFSSNASKKLIQMRVRHSHHGANTPGLKALRAHQQGDTDQMLGFPTSGAERSNGNAHQGLVYGSSGGFSEGISTGKTAVLDGYLSSKWEEGDNTVVIEPVGPLPSGLPDGFRTSSEGTDGKYKFSPSDSIIVVELYKAYRSIDKVLAHMERGARWHKDASRLIRDAGLL